MKITKSDVLNNTKGMLQMQLYVVHTKPTGSLEPVMDVMTEHLNFQVRIEQEGIMFAAGPIWADDEETWNGEGMVVIRAKNLAHAHEIASQDPMHACGAREFSIRPWLVNEGGFTLRATFSDSAQKLN